MTELQKEFEATGYASWVVSDLYPDGKAYTNEYVKWLEDKISQQRESGIREGFEAAREVENTIHTRKRIIPSTTTFPLSVEKNS